VAFLRKSALDELPQLINILKGQMSLVGPRPLVVEEDQRVEGWHRRRLELMPGMTGHWQILGPAKVPLGEMVAIDYLYVANCRSGRTSRSCCVLSRTSSGGAGI